jgi:hypothetical protein
MYYSWFNISAELQNNTFTISYLNTLGVLTNVNIVIPDGTYEIVTLNALLQFEFIQLGLYLLETATSKNVYYAEFILNPSRYAVQINTFLFPTSLPAGYTAPANFVGFAPTTYNPVITLPANINKIFGFNAGFATDLNTSNSYTPPSGSTLIAKNGAGTISYLSNTSPQLQPNPSVYFAISNINNQYSQPSSIIYALVPTVRIGEVIIERPPQFAWNALIDGTYNELRLTFLGSDLAPITINDPNMTILLVIKDNSEGGHKI